MLHFATTGVCHLNYDFCPVIHSPVAFCWTSILSIHVELFVWENQTSWQNAEISHHSLLLRERKQRTKRCHFLASATQTQQSKARGKSPCAYWQGSSHLKFAIWVVLCFQLSNQSLCLTSRKSPTFAEKSSSYLSCTPIL